MNDGFCDICLTFKGHDDLKAAFGVLFCSQCRERWMKIKRSDLAEQFRRIIIGAEEET